MTGTKITDPTVELAHRLADASGEIIRKYFRSPHLSAATKSGEVSSIVTIADRLAEEAMVNLILEYAPDDGIIREEGENLPSRSGRYWVLDPIDGTSSFVKGLPIFGTLIGLIGEDSPEPLLGLVNQPILGDRWLGIHDRPTTYNNSPIVNPYREDYPLEDACLTSTTPRMFLTPRQREIAGRLQEICKRNAFGGDCYNYTALASGWNALPMVILEADMKYYDFCALIPILKGAGASISDWEGKPLNAHSSEVLAASNAYLLERVLKVIDDRS